MIDGANESSDAAADESAGIESGARNESRRQEAQAYLVKVVEELGRREARLSALDGLIAQIKFELSELQTEALRPMGSAARLIAGESRRKSLLEQLERMAKERGELTEDVRRALERRKMTEQELKELE